MVYLRSSECAVECTTMSFPRGLKYVYVRSYIIYGCILEWIRTIRRYHLVIGSVSPSVYFIGVRIVPVLGGKPTLCWRGGGGGEFMCLIIVRFLVREIVERVELDGSHLGGFYYHTRCGNILRLRKRKLVSLYWGTESTLVQVTCLLKSVLVMPFRS